MSEDKDVLLGPDTDRYREDDVHVIFIFLLKDVHALIEDDT